MNTKQRMARAMLLGCLCFKLVSCAASEEGEPVVAEEAVSLSVGVVQGSSGALATLGYVLGELSSQNHYTWQSEGDEASLHLALAEGTVDLAFVSSLWAAEYYAQADNITALGVYESGGMYFLAEGEEIYLLADLLGRNLWTLSADSPLRDMTEILWARTGLAEELQWQEGSLDEITAGLSQGDVALLSEPYASRVLAENPKVGELLSLRGQWGSAMPVGVVVVRNEVLAAHEKAVTLFLSDLESSILWVTEESEGEKMAELGYGDSADQWDLLLARSNLYLQTGSAMQSGLQSFYVTLFQGNPATIGGGVPYDDFYYMSQ